MRCVGPSVTDRLKSLAGGSGEGRARKGGRGGIFCQYGTGVHAFMFSIACITGIFCFSIMSLPHSLTQKEKGKKNEFSADSEMEDVSTASHFCRRRKKTCCKWVSHKSLDPKTQVIISPSVLLQVKSVYITRGRHVISFFLPQSVIHGAPVVHASLSPMLATMALTIDSVNAAPSLFTTIIELHLPATHRRNHLRMLGRFRIRKMVAVAPTINAYQKKPTHHPLLSTSDPCAKNMRAFLVRLSLVIA